MLNVSNDLVNEMKDLAKKHPTVESWLQEVQRLGDFVWNRVRQDGDKADQTLDSGVEGVDKNVFDTPSEVPQPVGVSTEPAPAPVNEAEPTAANPVEEDHRSDAELRGPAAS